MTIQTKASNILTVVGKMMTNYSTMTNMK